MINYSFILLQQSTTSDPNALIKNVLLIVGIGIIFYLFMIRPQQKKQKKQKSFLENVKKGDTIVTIGGMHGKIYEVLQDEIVLELDKGMKVKFEKTAISLEASKKYQETEKKQMA